jgi:hypothetical protein
MADECCRPGDSQSDPNAEFSPLERKLFEHLASLPDVTPQQLAAMVMGFTVREHFEEAHPAEVSRGVELYGDRIPEQQREHWLLGYRFRDDVAALPPGARLAVSLTQLVVEGGADLADELALLVASGVLSTTDALDAIDTATTLAKAEAAGDVTDAQAMDLIHQVAGRHITGEQG